MDLPPAPLPLPYVPPVQLDMSRSDELPEWSQSPGEGVSQPPTSTTWYQEERPPPSDAAAEWEKLLEALLIE